MEAVVLAGGKGKRMKSARNKLLHRVCGKPLIFYTLKSVEDFDVHVVVSEENRKEIEALFNGVVTHVQPEPKGTADAVRCALGSIRGDDVLIVGGDTPLMSRRDIEDARVRFAAGGFDVLVVCAEMSDPSGYGRVVVNKGGVRIVEEADADEFIRSVRLVNGGVYFVKAAYLKRVLGSVSSDNAQCEFYLTDMLKFSENVGLFEVDPESIMGVNTRRDLEVVRKIIQKRILDRFDGVTFVGLESVFVDYDVEIGDDTVIFGGSHIRGNTKIGSGCVIDVGCVVEDSVIHDNVSLKPYSVVEGSEVKSFATVGPFAHLRPGSVIGEEVKIGNFVETKKAVVGRGSKASHLTYLGDAELGEGVNVGCGTITCNYDGYKKNKTVVGDRVFIGSDTQLVAPVEVEHDAYIAAGTTVTKKVDAYSLAISRVKQINIQGWVKRYRKKMEGKCAE